MLSPYRGLLVVSCAEAEVARANSAVALETQAPSRIVLDSNVVVEKVRGPSLLRGNGLGGEPPSSHWKAVGGPPYDRRAGVISG